MRGLEEQIAAMVAGSFSQPFLPGVESLISLQDSGAQGFASVNAAKVSQLEEKALGTSIQMSLEIFAQILPIDGRHSGRGAASDKQRL